MSVDTSNVQLFNKKLKEFIFDQDEAIDVITDTLLGLPLMVKNGSSPLAMFFICGVASSGKKFLSSQIATHLQLGHKIFVMGEYSQLDDADKLFAQASVGGEVATFLKENPSSVIVFDEIEKAHESVQTHMIRFLRESHNDISFNNVIVIFTSILGKAFYQNKEFQDAVFRNYFTSGPYIYDLLSKEQKMHDDQFINVFSYSLISLLSNQATLIILKPTSFATQKKIALSCLKANLLKFEKKFVLNIEDDDLVKIATFLLLSFLPHLDANRVVHQITPMLLHIIIQQIKTISNISKTIRIVIGDKAKILFFKVISDEELFVRTMVRLQEQINLEWSVAEYKDEIIITLNDALLKPLHFSMATKAIEPVVKYSAHGFLSVAGQDNVKQSLLEIVKLIKYPEKLVRFGISRPRGVVLYGPQGTGKSMLAEAFAFEVDLPYIRISGADLFDPELIQLTYTKARESSPCIVILDEIDSKGVSGGLVSAVPASYIASYFNLGDVFTIATARVLEDIPGEVIAPGSLDIMIEVGELDKDARKFFIEKIFEKPHNKNIDTDKVIAYMTGMNGYDLQRIGTQAALSAIIHGADEITEDMLVDQINKIKYGEKIEPQRIKNPEEEKIMTAYHEAGHAVLSLMLLPQVKIEQVTVAPRNEALGFVSYNDEDFVTTATKDEIFKNLCVLMAGRVVKIKKFGEKGIDSGDVADIGQATLEAYAAIAHLGMDEELGYINILPLTEAHATGFLKEKIESRVLFWLNNSRQETITLVDKYWSTITFVAEKLIDKEMLSGEELAKILRDLGHVS